LISIEKQLTEVDSGSEDEPLTTTCEAGEETTCPVLQKIERDKNQDEVKKRSDMDMIPIMAIIL
jgi:hypothetical protein